MKLVNREEGSGGHWWVSSDDPGTEKRGPWARPLAAQCGVQKAGGPGWQPLEVFGGQFPQIGQGDRKLTPGEWSPSLGRTATGGGQAGRWPSTQLLPAAEAPAPAEQRCGLDGEEPVVVPGVFGPWGAVRGPRLGSLGGGGSPAKSPVGGVNIPRPAEVTCKPEARWVVGPPQTPPHTQGPVRGSPVGSWTVSTLVSCPGYPFGV